MKRGKYGSFRRTIYNIREKIRTKFIPKSETASYDTTTGTATAGTSTSGEQGTSFSGGGGGGTSYSEYSARSGLTTQQATQRAEQQKQIPTTTPTPTRQTLTTQQLRNIDLSKYSGRKIEVYDPRTGSYKTAPYGSGAGGTVIQRQPTPQEQIKIQQAEDKGDIAKALTGYSRREYKDIINLQDKISRESNVLNKEIINFENKYKDLIKDNKFVGTQQEYNKYLIDYEKVNIERIKVEGRIKQYKRVGGTISKEGLIEVPKVSLGGLRIGDKQILKGREIPITKFKGLYSDTGVPIVDVTRQVSSAFGIGARQMFFAGGEGLGKVLGGEKKYTILKAKDLPDLKLENVFVPQYGTATEYNPLTGEVKQKYEDKLITERKRPELYFTGEQLGKVTGDISVIGAEGAKYVIPYAGATFFAGEFSGEVIEAGGVKQYIKEKPVEAALLGTVIVGGGIFMGARYLAKPIIVETKAGIKLTTRAKELFGARVRLEKGKISLLPSKRRSILEVERVKIKKPKQKLEASETIALDIKKGKKESTLFEEQKLFQESVEGERAVVRRFNPETGKYEIVYRGIPKTKVGKEGYEKTIKLFEEYGIKAKDIKPYLRYRAPKVIEQKLESGLINLKGIRATGKFKYLTEQPVIELDKRLGIKTRGARTIKDDIFVERMALKKVGAESKLGIKSAERGKGILDIKEVEFKQSMIQARVSGKGTGYLPVGKFEGALQVSIKAPVKTIESVSVGKYVPELGKKTLFVDTGKTTLIGIEIKGAKGVQRVLGKKSSQQYLEQLYAQELKAAPILKAPIVKAPKQITKIPSIKPTEQRYVPLMVGGTRFVPQQDYSSLISGDVSTYSSTEVSAVALPSVIKPVLIPRAGEEYKFDSRLKYDTMLKLDTGLKTDTGLKYDTGSKFDVGIKSDIRFKEQLREGVKEKVSQKVRIKQVELLKEVLKQKQQLRQEQKQQQRQKQVKRLKSKIILPPILLGDSSKKKRTAKDVLKEFEVWVTKEEKEEKVGVFGTLAKARKELKEELIGTLRAGGGVKFKGKPLTFREIGLFGGEFRPSKVSQFKVIQKRERRLGGKQEVREIQFFKKAGGMNFI